MKNDINRYLDAAILRPEMSRPEVTEAIESCLPFRPRTFCLRPCDLSWVGSHCEGSGIGIGVVLAFPHGTQLPASKADEARRYIDLGVDEIDMVANFGWIRSGNWSGLLDEVAQVVSLTRPAGVCLKVIFETTHLNPNEICQMIELSVKAGADYVKTSTGFNGPGASDEDVRLMVNTAAGRIKVKPSGGIRGLERALSLLSLGAERLGVNFSAVPDLCGTPSNAHPQDGY